MHSNYAVLFQCPIPIPKNTTKPWVSCEICANIKKMQNCYSLVRQNKLSHQFCARFRNFVTNQIRQAKINYFAENFNSLKEIVKALGSK